MSGNPYYQSAHWKRLRTQCIARDGGKCTVAGCPKPGRVADHKVTRPAVPYPTAADTLNNLRTLCTTHDAQVKEQRRGQDSRKQGGEFRVKGCDADGIPFDPRHNQ